MRKPMKNWKEAKVDAFMTFVRAFPVPNIFLFLESDWLVMFQQQFFSEREVEGCKNLIQDIRLEMIHPTDERDYY